MSLRYGVPSSATLQDTPASVSVQASSFLKPRLTVGLLAFSWKAIQCTFIHSALVTRAQLPVRRCSAAQLAKTVHGRRKAGHSGLRVVSSPCPVVPLLRVVFTCWLDWKKPEDRRSCVPALSQTLGARSSFRRALKWWPGITGQKEQHMSVGKSTNLPMFLRRNVCQPGCQGDIRLPPHSFSRG